MARLNRDMERAAVDELDPGPGDAVLAVGFGPGVGIEELVVRLPQGQIAGLDPSATMVALARRRNRAAIDAGRVSLVRGDASSIPWPDDAFAGVVAVNSLQLWDPLPASVHEVARVLAPGGALVTVTHTWAVEKLGSLDEWLDHTSALFEHGGMGEVTQRTAGFRSGPGVLLCARMLRTRNRTAP